MMARAALYVVLLAFAAPAEASHPIAGVISLLQRLAVQAKEEGAAEAALFQKFVYWCKTSEKKLDKAIKIENANIEELTDKIDGLTADIATLTTEITQLGEDITTKNNAATKAQTVRNDEHQLYLDEQSNFDGTITAVDGAVDAMVSSGSLLQTKAKQLKIAKKAPEAPEAQQYAFKSGGIIETFKGLGGEFEGEKLDSTQQETNKLNAYNLAKQARDFAIKAAEDSKTEKEGIKGDKQSSKSSANSDLTSEKASLVSDSSTLDNTQKSCKTKSDEWQDRSAVREGEIKAMDMAVKILGKVTGVRNPDSHTIPSRSGLIEATARIEQDTSDFQAKLSFLQIDDPRKKAMNLLRKAAEKGHSKALQKLASEIGSYEGPFDKIKDMMQKMIYRLMSEQKDEDDHKNWCDLETEKNTEVRTDKNDKIVDMTAKIAQMQAEINLLTGNIADNAARVEEITASLKTETEIRQENHDEIVLTIKDSQDAQGAVTQAIAVLSDFYKSSGQVVKEPWEFIQLHKDVQLPANPDTWDASYTGVANPQSGSDGVLSILDGVMQKFSSMEANAKVQDETDQKNFDHNTQSMKIELGEKNTDSEMKTSKKDGLTEKVEGMSAQLKSTQAEYDAVHQYLKDLEPACGEGDSSYDERKQARSDEITALRQAQVILEDAFRAQAAFLQHK